MYNVFQTIHIVLSILIVVLVLIQSKGGGLTSGIGNSIGFYRSRRGLEKVVFITTIVVAILVAANSLLLVILS